MEPDPEFVAMLIARAETKLARYTELVARRRVLNEEMHELAGSLCGLAAFQRSQGWEAVDTTLAEAILTPGRRASRELLREAGDDL